MKHLISHAATVLPVSNLQEALTYYTEKLGFEVNFLLHEPPNYAVLKLNEVSIHLSQVDDPSKDKILETIERS